MSSKFKFYDVVFPDHKNIKVFARSTSNKIEVGIPIDQAEQLVEKLQQMIYYAKLNKINTITFYVRDKDEY